MKFPTTEEIKEAHDAIQDDGPQSETTVTLCTLLVLDPFLRTTVNQMAQVLNSLPPADGLLADANKKAFVVSCIATGLNYALRIGETRQQGMATRQSVENLLHHLKDNHCGGIPECIAENIKMLEWVLGKKP